MRKFLVVLDDSRECLNAMRFAAMRAANTGGGVEILSVIPPDEFQHWIGVGEVMREETRERIVAHFEVFAKWMRDKQGIDINAIAAGLQRISQLATDFPQIIEIDINPFIVGDVGTEPVVADVHLTLTS